MRYPNITQVPTFSPSERGSCKIRKSMLSSHSWHPWYKGTWFSSRYFSPWKWARKVKNLWGLWKKRGTMGTSGKIFRYFRCLYGNNFGVSRLQSSRFYPYLREIQADDENNCRLNIPSCDKENFWKLRPYSCLATWYFLRSGFIMWYYGQRAISDLLVSL